MADLTGLARPDGNNNPDPLAPVHGDAEQEAALRLWRARQSPQVETVLRAARARAATQGIDAHPSGLGGRATGEQVCGLCAWRAAHDGICLQAAEDPVWPSMYLPGADQPGCHRWEPRLRAMNCRRCAACCREGFDEVEVEDPSAVSPLAGRFLTTDANGVHRLRRIDGRCPLLAMTRGGWTACRRHVRRPVACRELEPGSPACLWARRRTGARDGMMVFMPTETMHDDLDLLNQGGEAAVVGVMGEIAFADAWVVEDPVVPSTDDVRVVVEGRAPAGLRVQVAMDSETLLDIATGFHALPDTHVDREMHLDVLAEVALAICNDLCQILRRQPPGQAEPEEMQDWSDLEWNRTFGINERGRLHVSVGRTGGSEPHR